MSRTRRVRHTAARPLISAGAATQLYLGLPSYSAWQQESGGDQPRALFAQTETDAPDAGCERGAKRYGVSEYPHAPTTVGGSITALDVEQPPDAALEAVFSGLRILRLDERLIQFR